MPKICRYETRRKNEGNWAKLIRTKQAGMMWKAMKIKQRKNVKKKWRQIRIVTCYMPFSSSLKEMKTKLKNIEVSVSRSVLLNRCVPGTLGIPQEVARVSARGR